MKLVAAQGKSGNFSIPRFSWRAGAGGPNQHAPLARQVTIGYLTQLRLAAPISGLWQ